MRHKIFLLLLCLTFSGCAAIQEKIPFLASKKKPMVGGVYKENFDPDRLVDLTIVRKITGEKRLWIFTKYTQYLEGYIRGAIVEYDDTPMDGIVARVTDGKGKDLPGFDPGISDANGVYRIRFSLPVKDNVVDQRGAISYNPPWQQQLNILGAAMEPQTKETKFRLYYNKSMGVIGIGEDIPKTITRKVTGAGDVRETKEEEKKKPEPKKAAPPPPPPKQENKNDDFFGGGGFGDFK